MSELLLLAKKHIANRQAMEQFECCICYELTEEVRACKGPCAKPYCPKCIGRTKYNKDACPFKCSYPFDTQPIPQLKLLYRCPYNYENCKALFHNVQDFQRHCEQCQFITPQGQKELFDKKHFLCEKGHKLELFTLSILKKLSEKDQCFYTLVMNDLCFGCGGRNLCRSICMQCSNQQKRHVYCVDCRKFPFTKTKCPIGHAYQQTNLISNYGCVCDRCGISGCLLGKKGYSDYVCDIFLCQKCQQIIPEYGSQPEPKEVEIVLAVPHGTSSSSQ